MKTPDGVEIGKGWSAALTVTEANTRLMKINQRLCKDLSRAEALNTERFDRLSDMATRESLAVRRCEDLEAENARLREALNDCMMWLSAFAQGTGNRETVQSTERYARYIAALNSTKEAGK